MPIKNHQLYPQFVIFLDTKGLTRGGFELSKLSQNVFDEFVTRYKSNPKFKNKIDNQYKTIQRGEKINNIIVEEDFELFLNQVVDPPTLVERNDCNLFDF